MSYNSFDISDYIEPIFRFCLKRLHDRNEVEDLSQEILMHILESMRNSEIKNPQAYVWQIARNRYAKKIAQKNKQNHREIYSGETLYSIADNIFVEDEFILREEHKSVFKAVHSLSASYRDILVDYYVSEMCVKEISEKHKLTQETIRWRLHVAKEKIKERVNNMNTEKVYERLDWDIKCNGSFDAQKYLGTQIYKAIADSCYEKPIDIEEISLKTGIPTLYLDELLEHMIYGDAIEKIGGKYATNFIILYADDNKKMQKIIIETAKGLSQKVWDIFEKSLPEIKNNLAYGKGFPAEKLGYIFIPMLMMKIMSVAQSANSDLKNRKPFIRIDGGYGWFIVNENDEYLSKLNGGCNFDHSESDGIGYDIYYYWFGEFDYQLNSFLKRQSCVASYFDENGIYTNPYKDDVMTAELIKYNIMSKDNGAYKSHIPVTTRGGVENIMNILEKYQDEIDLTEYVNKIYSEYKRFVPERLYDQIKGNIGSYCGGIIRLIQEELVKQRLLRDYAYDETFTDNIWFVVG